MLPKGACTSHDRVEHGEHKPMSAAIRCRRRRGHSEHTGRVDSSVDSLALGKKKTLMLITASLTMLCAREQGGFIGGHSDLPGKGNEKRFCEWPEGGWG